MDRYRKIQYIIFWFITVLFFVGARLTAQTLVVGELAGRFEYRQATSILTANVHPLARFVDPRAVRLVKQSPDEIVFEYDAARPKHVKTVILRLFPSEMALMTAIIIDEVDFAYSESSTIANDVHKSNPVVRVLFQFNPPNYVKLIAYNNQLEIFRSTLVRQALSHAINKTGLINSLLNKQANKTSGPIDHNSKYFDSGFKEFDYDPRAAIKLLNQDGWIEQDKSGILKKNGQALSFTLAYERGNYLDEQIVRMVKIDWNKIGIDVAIRPIPRLEIQNKIQSHIYDAVITDMQLVETVDNLNFFWGSRQQMNIFNYKNFSVDHYLSLAGRADDNTRNRLIQGILNLVIQDQPASFLFFPWLEWYFINSSRFDHFTDEGGEIRPFDEWIVKP
jgi:ABC-type transport system substrate-binding protein